MSDIPFKDACAQAMDLMAKGMDVYQKFTCAGCGNRLTMEKPNIFFKQGTCDNCAATTDIEAQGCGYLVHARPEVSAVMLAELLKRRGGNP